MTLTACERRQPLSAFQRAGRNAFLAFIPQNSNPYKDKPQRDAWDRGWAKTKAQYQINYAVEVKVAVWLGYPAPVRQSYQVRQREGRVNSSRPNPSNPPQERRTFLKQGAASKNASFRMAYGR